MDQYITEEKRPRKTMNRLAKEARELAQRTGRLPHEILLDIARGKPVGIPRIDQQSGEIIWIREGVPLCDFVVPDLPAIIESAKAAAPYYAPKISTIEVIQGVSDHELDRIIALAASEAGLSVGYSGEVETDPVEADADGRVGTRVRLNVEL